MEKQFVGIDVSKQKLDVAILPKGESFSLSYRDEEIEGLIRRLKQINPSLIVVEATGGYERRILEALCLDELPVALVNPKRVREFAKASGVVAKTDKLDARILAQFASTFNPRPYTLAPHKHRHLKELTRRRRQLVQMRTGELSRFQRASSPIREQIQSHIIWLDEQIDQIDGQINSLIQQIPQYREKVELLKSVPGVGQVTAVTLIAELPQLGQVNKKEIAAMVGVAPINRESGKWKGKSSIQAGRGIVRSVLYMATLSAIRSNPVFRVRYHRLLDKGKEKKVAITACMRYLLVVLNGIVRGGQPWNPEICAPSVS